MKYWLPVLLWMAVIFSASADSHSYQHSEEVMGLFEPLLHWLFPSLSPKSIGLIHEVARKCCHLTVYAVLALLVWRAVHASKSGLPAWSWPKVGGTLLVVLLYAASDEFHQSFVPTRTAHVTDVLIDTSGGALALFGLWIWKRRNRQRQTAE
ncbi:MAG TPA: VanZ family protein [Verrucomicrobiae bacterium]|nr:VanZ family protein [Verrucomicrobiae bacterium]